MLFRIFSLLTFVVLFTTTARAQEVTSTLPDFKPFHLRPLPMARWLVEDAVTVVSSPHDIGEIKNIFDGDFSTVLRSAQVNPQQTTVQFDDAVSVAAIRVVTSDPQDRWKIEGFVWTAGAQTPTKYEIVPWTNVEFKTGTVNEIIFPRNLSVTELTLTLERINGDDFVHLHEWELLAEVLDKTQK